MLFVDNRTPFPAQLAPALGPSGDDYAFVVVKATFDLEHTGGAAPRLAEEQTPLRYADEYIGEPGHSSVRYPCDLTPPKATTDVLLVGHARAARPITHTDVTLTLGSLSKAVRVTGDRVYFRTVGSWGISDPTPFEHMPLTFERAFGGTDGDDFEDKNPVGCGFVAPNSESDLEGWRLPNLEEPRELLTAPGQRPAPSGFGIVAPNWQPRRGRAGTYDEKWRTERCPLVPADFDTRFHQLAQDDLIAAEPLRGGETCHVTSVLPRGGALSFLLPTIELMVESRIKGHNHTPEAALNTVLIDADAQRLELTWTAKLPCEREFLLIEWVRLSTGNRPA